jgi:hypothetical protein
LLGWSATLCATEPAVGQPDPAWQPIASTGPVAQAPGADLGAPIASVGTAQPQRQSSPSVLLDRPVAQSAQPAAPPRPLAINDPGFQPVGFLGGKSSLFGTPTPENAVSEVASVRPEVAQPAQGMFTWRPAQAAQQVDSLKRVSAPVIVQGSSPVAVTPPAGPHAILPQPTLSQPLGAQPVVPHSGIPQPLVGNGVHPPMGQSGDCGGNCGGNCGGDCGSCGGGCFTSCWNDSCCESGCDNCDGCDYECYAPYDRWYFGAEYLMWWGKGDRLPPLVTTGSAADPIPGALGQPGTALLFGNEEIGDDVRMGVRFSGGFWFTEDRCWGLYGSVFFLNEQTNEFFAASSGTPVLARPFVDFTPGTPTFGQENSQLKGLNNVVAGFVKVDHSTRLWGGDANVRYNWCCTPAHSFDIILGYRGMSLEDDLAINELISSHDPQSPGSILITDTFQTSNRFNGGQIGFLHEWRLGERWSLGLKAKVALGNTRQKVMIAGVSQIEGTRTAADGVYNTGILATPSNSGSFSRDKFTVIPEVGIDLGFHLTERIRASVGYNFLYWSDVVRAGEQIDRGVDTRQWAPPIGAGDRPAFQFNSSSYWAQGLTFGLEFRF